MFVKGNSFPAFYNTIRDDPGALDKVDREGSHPLADVFLAGGAGEQVTRHSSGTPKTLDGTEAANQRAHLVATFGDQNGSRIMQNVQCVT